MPNHNHNGQSNQGRDGNIDRGGMGQSGYGAGNGDDRWQQSQDAMQRARGGEGRWQGERNFSDERQGDAGRDLGMQRDQRSEYGSRGLQVGQHPYEQDGQGSGPSQGSYNQGSFGSYQGSAGSQGGYSQGSDGAAFGSQGSQGLSFRSRHQGGSGPAPYGWSNPGPHKGKGPKNWQRSDEKLRDLASEALHDDEHIDATHIEIQVKDGEATLTGTVEDRRTKRMAEDCVERVTGIKDVQNLLKIQAPGAGAMAKGQGNAGASNGATPEAKDDRKARA